MIKYILKQNDILYYLNQHTETKSNNILLFKLAFILTVNIFVNNWQSFGQALYPNCGLEEGECTVILS